MYLCLFFLPPLTPPPPPPQGIVITTSVSNVKAATDTVNHGLLYAPKDELSCDPAVRVQQLFAIRSEKGSGSVSATVAAAVGGGAGTSGTRPKAALLSAATTTVAAPVEFTLDELTPYFTEFVGGVGQPKSVVELLLPYAKLDAAKGVYTKK